MAEVRVRLNSDGVWCCRPYLGTNAATGKPIRPYRQFPEARSEAEAQAIAEAWVAPMLAGDLASCLMAYVDDVEAMGARKGHGTRPNTVRNYRLMARRLGAILSGETASTVTAARVTAAYRELLDPGGAWRLSPSTVAGYHWFLCGAFRWMVAQGLAASSPMGGVSHPTAARLPEATARALDEADLELLVPALDALRGDGDADPRDREAAWAATIALGTGMRVGEVCGLSRRDHRSGVPDLHVRRIAVEEGGLHLQEVPKGSRSRRVTLSDEDELLVSGHLAERRGLGADAPVVTVDGSLMAPSDVSSRFRAICRSAGLPGWVRFHTLRHTHATQLLLAGADMRTVQERLGHADVATTLRLYGHVLPGRDAAAAGAFAELLGRIREERRSE